MNKKQIVIILVSIFSLGLTCFISYLVYKPQVDIAVATRVRGATETSGAEIGLTETRIAILDKTSSSFSMTQTAEPTHTLTSTPTLPPTNTSTSTVPANFGYCTATVVKDNVNLYDFPGGETGLYLGVNHPIEIDQELEIAAGLEDSGWYLVEYSNDVYWVASNNFTKNNPLCKTNVYTLAFLLDFEGYSKSYIDETFSGNKYFWAVDNDPVQTLVTDFGEAFIRVRAQDPTSIVPSLPEQDLGNPYRAIVLFDRSNNSGESYVGIRFRTGELSFYEVQILTDCTVIVQSEVGIILARSTTQESNNCRDLIPDLLQVELNSDNSLAITLNESTPINVTLPDEFHDSTGRFELIANDVTASFFYFLVVQ